MHMCSLGTLTLFFIFITGTLTPIINWLPGDLFSMDVLMATVRKLFIWNVAKTIVPQLFFFLFLFFFLQWFFSVWFATWSQRGQRGIKCGCSKAYEEQGCGLGEFYSW